MSVSVTKNGFNVREKLKQLQKPIGLKGSELMRAETAQEARELVSAGRKNMIINGAMQVAQRGTSFAVTNNSPFTLDRWQAGTSSGYDWGSTITQSTESPDGFGYSLKVDVTTVNAFGTSDSAILTTKIEGQNLQQLAFGTSSAKPITLSFWVRSNKLGTYSVQILCLDAQRHCVVDYTINYENTWEYKTITLPGQTSETIANNNSAGIEIRFGLGSDAADQVAPNSTWVDYSSNGIRTSTNQINFFDSTSNEWYLTGVQLEVGKNATEFEHRSYGEELALCQRYFQAFNYGSLCWMSPRSPQGTYTELTYGSMKLKTTMRATPTIGVIGTSFQGVRYNGSGYSTSTLVNPSSNITLEYAGLDCVTPRLTWNFNWTVNDLINFVVSANDGSALTFSAEL